MKAQVFITKKHGEEMLGEVYISEQGHAYASTTKLQHMLDNWTIFEAGDKPKPVPMSDGSAYLRALAQTPSNGYFFVNLVE